MAWLVMDDNNRYTSYTTQSAIAVLGSTGCGLTIKPVAVAQAVPDADAAGPVPKQRPNQVIRKRALCELDSPGSWDKRFRYVLVRFLNPSTLVPRQWAPRTSRTPQPAPARSATVLRLTGPPSQEGHYL